MSTPEVPSNFEYFDDDMEPQINEPKTLERLVLMAENAKTLAAEINEAATALAELQGKHEKLVRVRIPDLMTELGLENFKLKSGEVIEVKEDIKTSISEENKPAAWVWLEERQFDGIIKTQVAMSFGKGEMKKAVEVVEKLEGLGLHADLTRAVHPMTLKSFVKEQLEKGTAIPLDVFNVFEFKEAKFKSPKVSKAKR